MDYLDAAPTVLREAGRPMSSREITDEVLRRGLIEPAGKTPGATMSARLYVYVRDHPDGELARLAEAGSKRAVRWKAR